MDHRNKRERRKYLKEDLLQCMLGDNIIIPEEIYIDEIAEEWFSHQETDLAVEIVEELVSNKDCPLEYSAGRRNQVWLLDREDTEEFIKDLRDIPWYEL